MIDYMRVCRLPWQGVWIWHCFTAQCTILRSTLVAYLDMRFQNIFIFVRPITDVTSKLFSIFCSMYEFGVSVDPRCRFKWFATNLAQVRSCILTVFPMHLTLMSLQISYRRKPAISYIKHELIRRLRFLLFMIFVRSSLPCTLITWNSFFPSNVYWFMFAQQEIRWEYFVTILASISFLLQDFMIGHVLPAKNWLSVQIRQ